MSKIPERISELANAVRSTFGFEGWDADYTPASLTPLGDWFSREVTTRAQTNAEREELQSHLRFPIDIPNEVLTDEALSLAGDVGMYFGEMVTRNLPGTKWDQATKNKAYADYGHLVIMGFGTVPLNPLRIATNLAYAFAAKEQVGGRLRELFDIWCAKRK